MMNCFTFCLVLLLPFVNGLAPYEHQELVSEIAGKFLYGKDGDVTIFFKNATVATCEPLTTSDGPRLSFIGAPIMIEYLNRREIKNFVDVNLHGENYICRVFEEYDLSVELVEYWMSSDKKFKMSLKRAQSKFKKCSRVYSQIESGKDSAYRKACLLGCHKYQDYDECVDEFFGLQFMVKDLYNAGRKFMKSVGDPNEFDLSDDEGPSEAYEQGVENLWDIASHLWPAVLSWFPLLLVQYKKYNWGVAIAILFFILPVAYSVDESRSLWLVNMFVTLLSVFLLPDSPEIAEVASSSVMTGLVMLSGLVLDKYQQFALIITLIVIYLSFLGHLWRKKRAGSQVGVLMLILQVIVLHEESIYVRENFERDFLHYGIETILFTIVPQGKSQFLIPNSGRLATILSRYLASYQSKQGIYGVIAFFMILFLFLVSRAIFGGMMLTSIRWRLDSINVWDAFMTYCTGMLTPWKIFLIALPGRNVNLKKMTYAMVAGIMQWYEFNYCLEFFVLRIVLSIFDWMFLNGHYGDQTRMLCDNFFHCNQKFVQSGALPRYSSAQVALVKEKTVKLFCDSGRAGAGLLRKTKDGKGQIITVAHVLEGASSLDVLRTNKKRESLLSINKDSLFGRDPVQVVDFPCDGMALPVLRANEMSAAKMLMTFSPNENDPTIIDINSITDFKFTSTGEIDVCATYIQGESGSPVIALVDDYEMRLAGVVSAGRTDQYAGNICSSVIMNDDFLYKTPPRTPPDSPPRDTVVLAEHDAKRTRLRLQSEFYSTLKELYELAQKSRRYKKKDFIVVDPGSEEGWQYFEDEYEPDPDLEYDTDEDQEGKDKKGKERQTRKKRFKEKQQRQRGEYNRKRDQLFLLLHSLAKPLHGSVQADHLLSYIKHRGPIDVRGNLCTLHIKSDDEIIIDETPNWHED